jgi:DNA-directed RNA polymerase specialized sigma24 family protein
MAQDVSAIRVLYLRQRDALVRFLIQRTRDPALAEDIAQETWLRIDHTGAVSAVHNPKAYLFRIASNLAIDYLRIQNRRKLSPVRSRQRCRSLTRSRPRSKQPSIARNCASWSTRSPLCRSGNAASCS